MIPSKLLHSVYLCYLDLNKERARGAAPSRTCLFREALDAARRHDCPAKASSSSSSLEKMCHFIKTVEGTHKLAGSKGGEVALHTSNCSTGWGGHILQVHG